MKTRLEQYYEDELGKLLLHSIHAHNGKLEDELYRIMNEGEALSDPFGEEAYLKGSDILRLQTEPIRLPQMDGRDQVRLKALEQQISAACNAPKPKHFKEYVFRIPDHHMEIRVSFSKGV